MAQLNDNLTQQLLQAQQIDETGPPATGAEGMTEEAVAQQQQQAMEQQAMQQQQAAVEEELARKEQSLQQVAALEEQQIPLSPEEEQKIVAKVWEDYRYARMAKEDQHAKWKKYEDYYKNDQWKGKKVDPKRIKPTINYAFSTVESLMPYLTANQPDPIVLPTHPDDEDTAADLTKIVKIILQKNGMDEALQLAERARLKFGTSIWKVFFDPTKYNGLGDIAFEVVDPMDFYIDPNCVRDLQTADYCMTVTRRSVSYLQNRYPDKANEIQADQDANSMFEYGDPDAQNDVRATQATVIEYWTKRPEDGLVRIVVAGHTLLRFQPNFYQHGRYPFTVCRDYPLQKSFWGMGEIEQLESLQDILNKLLQIVVENVALANGQLLVDKNLSGIKNIKAVSDQLWKPGLTIPVDDVNSIKKLDGVVAPAWVINLIEMIQSAIELVTGVSPVYMGNAPGSVTAASGILALQEQATARVRLKLQEQGRLIERLTKFIIDYAVEFYTEDRYFRYLDKNREPQWIQFNGQDLQQQNSFGEDFTPEFDVTVNVGYDTPMSRAYIEQQAQQLFQMGIIDGLEVMKTMNFPLKEEIIARLQQKQQVMGQLGALPQGVESPALQGQLAQLTGLENGNPTMPDGMNINNTNSQQDASEQQQQMSPETEGQLNQNM
jgi:hypothetical protein